MKTTIIRKMCLQCGCELQDPKPQTKFCRPCAVVRNKESQKRSIEYHRQREYHRLGKVRTKIVYTDREYSYIIQKYKPYEYTQKQIAVDLNRSEKSINNHIQILRQKGLI